MGNIRHSNNASAELAAGITNVATSVTVETGKGALFPAVGAGLYAKLTLEDAVGNFEVVHLTARSGDVLTVVRAQEGTVAQAFASGSRIENRITAATLNDFLQKAGDTMTGQLDLAGGGSIVNGRLEPDEIVDTKIRGATGVTSNEFYVPPGGNPPTIGGNNVFHVGNLLRPTVGSILFPTHAAETAASVTPTDFAYPWGHAKRYGVVGDGAADDTTPVANTLKVGHQGLAIDWGSNLVIITSPFSIKSANANVPPVMRGQNTTFKAKAGSSGVFVEIENPHGQWPSGVHYDGNFVLDANALCSAAFRLHGCQRSYIGPICGINAVGAGATDATIRVEAENGFGIFKNTFVKWQAGTITATGGASHGFLIKSIDASNRINANVWIDPVSIWNAGRGFDIDYCSDKFVGIHAELNDGEGIFVDHCPAITLDVGYTEHNHQNMSGGGASDATEDEAIEFTANSNFPRVFGGNVNGTVNASLANSPIIMPGSSGQISIMPNGLGFDGAAAPPSTLSGFNALDTKDFVIRAGGSTKTSWDFATNRWRTNVIHEFLAATVQDIETITYSASMTPDATTADQHVITATNGTSFTINAPSGSITGMVHTYTIRNSSGGALGSVTWAGVFKMSAWTQPGNGTSRSITFRYNGTNWVEIGRTPADVPN